MTKWGGLQEGTGEIIGCINCGKGTSPANPQLHFDALNAVSGVDFGVDSASPHATIETGGRSR